MTPLGSVLISLAAGAMMPSAFAVGTGAAGDEVGTAQPNSEVTSDSKPIKAGAPDERPKYNYHPPRLPNVATLLDTMRKRLEALNGPDMLRI